MTNIPEITIQISPGELLDKISILAIKMERLADPNQLMIVGVELLQLQDVRAGTRIDNSGVNPLFDELKRVNEQLWQIEEEIRVCERNKEFGPSFIELARGVYRNNDERARVKREINEHLGSTIIEEKSYEKY